ncbi:MFS transporter [Sphingomonas sp. PL-96]|uniref:MFS transporter n=1 Tax=Sphingomonas sp. PL-96 TaxID=2887201 RepID=UPI001E5D04C0|nr:MFS transporter [Sphingomonas sp. PL-96]MCC2976528.1 MFS transporter [Sphingomonas sp. PL-96]
MTTTALRAGTGAVDGGVYGKIAWRILPFLLLCYLAAYIDRVNIGFAKLQMSSDLGFSEAAYGLGAGIFFIGYSIFEVPSNLMLHKVGARRWIARILISWSLISACFAFVETETHFYILRFLLGVAEAGFAPGALLYLTYWFPAARRSRANSAMFLAIPLAGIIGAPLSGLIMEHMSGVAAWEGWRWMFVIEALPAMIAGLLTFRFLPDRPSDVDWLSPAEKRQVLDDLAADAGVRTEHLSVRQFLADKRLWLLCAIYFCVVMGQYAITFWLPTIVKNAGATGPLMNGMLTTLPFLAAMVAMLGFSFSADRHRERRWHLIVPMVVGAVALTIASFVPHDLTLSIVLLSIAAAGMLSATVMFWSLPPAFLGGVWAAAGIGGINAIGNVAGFVSPYVIGSLVSAGGDLRLGLYAITAAVLIGAALVLRVPRSANR